MKLHERCSRGGEGAASFSATCRLDHKLTITIKQQNIFRRRSRSLYEQVNNIGDLYASLTVNKIPTDCNSDAVINSLERDRRQARGQKKIEKRSRLFFFFSFLIFIFDIKVSLVDPSSSRVCNIGENYFRKIIEFVSAVIVVIKERKLSV